MFIRRFTCISVTSLVLVAGRKCAECPVDELPVPWLMNLMYCAWHGPLNEDIDVDTLAGCIAGLNDDSEPFRSSTILAEFIAPVRTPCAPRCLWHAARSIRWTYADPDFQSNCNLVDRTWQFLRNFMDSDECVAAKNNALLVFNQCAALPTTEAPPDTTTIPTTSTTSKGANSPILSRPPATTLVMLVLALAVVRTD